MSDASVTTWFAQPAENWLQALPIGNGRLGAMVSGRVGDEIILLDEESIWSGCPTKNDRPGAAAHLSAVRELVFTDRYEQAWQLAGENLVGNYDNFGTHLRAGALHLHMMHDNVQPGSYRRELDMAQAVTSVTYQADGLNFSRRAFASHPAQVLVFTFAADAAGAIGMDVRLDSERNIIERSDTSDELALTAVCPEGGVEFTIAARIVAQGGSTHADQGCIRIRHADHVTIYVDINSSFRGKDYQTLNDQHLHAAQQMVLEQLRDQHSEDFRKFFERVSLCLDGPDLDNVPMEQRLRDVQQGQSDPDLMAKFFQFGRYLLISCSRSDTLAAHLQGLWNDNKAAMMSWTCDYHLDINTQMNYWPAEVCNLGECHLPAFDLVAQLVEAGRNTARIHYDCAGWVAHIFTNLWGFTSPGRGERWGFHVTGGLWLALHLADHYRFNGDRVFLRDRAYLALKEAAAFFVDFLIEHPKYGWLVTCPSVSPENAFATTDGQQTGICAGPTCDTILLRELFGFCIEAAETLDIDADLRDQWAQARDKLPPLQIGKEGRLLEWLEEFAEPEPEHRHISHLLGLYPFFQISRETTPELAQAARAVLTHKMEQPDWEAVGWNRAWHINLAARLGDAELAYENLAGLLAITEPSLLTYHPACAGADSVEDIFELDGNTGGTAGMAEMLLQSHGGEIRLLPALPAAWPGGEVCGLRARGGFEIDITWDVGELVEARILSLWGRSCRILYRNQVLELAAEKDQVYTIHLRDQKLMFTGGIHS